MEFSEFPRLITNPDLTIHRRQKLAAAKFNVCGYFESLFRPSLIFRILAATMVSGAMHTARVGKLEQATELTSDSLLQHLLTVLGCTLTYDLVEPRTVGLVVHKAFKRA